MNKILKRIEESDLYVKLEKYRWKVRGRTFREPNGIKMGEEIMNTVKLALHELTWKEQKWKWEIRQEKSFEMLKKKFTIELILIASDFNKKIRMEVDISDYATGRVLLIVCVNKRWRPVAYFSKSWNETEWKYKNYDKELLVVIRELEVWRYLWEGTMFKVKIWIDYKNLGYFMKV